MIYKPKATIHSVASLSFEKLFYNDFLKTYKHESISTGEITLLQH